MSTPKYSGTTGLTHEEALVFERAHHDATAISLPGVSGPVSDALQPFLRRQPAGIPGLSEPEAVRHFVRLSQWNHGIETGFYPLGSCTMKYNPRVNESLVCLPGLAHLHPDQPEHTVQGALALLHELPLRQRQVLWLRRAATFTEAETAQILSIRPGTVKSQLHDAEIRLRELLQKSSDTWEAKIR